MQCPQSTVRSLSTARIRLIFSSVGCSLTYITNLSSRAAIAVFAGTKSRLPAAGSTPASPPASSLFSQNKKAALAPIMGQKLLLLRYHPNWRSRAHSLHTIMCSPRITGGVPVPRYCNAGSRGPHKSIQSGVCRRGSTPRSSLAGALPDLLTLAHRFG